MRAAVPYMLEDELAQDVDDLFFAYAKLNDDEDGHNCFVAVTERAQMLQWQGWLRDADIQANTIEPDVLAMPYTAGQWSAIALKATSTLASSSTNQTQIVVRQGQWQGFTVDSGAWQFIQQHVLATEPSDKAESSSEQASEATKEQDDITINAYSDLPCFNETEHPEGFRLVKSDADLPLALFAQHSQYSNFTLLQGEFKVKEQRSKNTNNWLWAAGIAACALLLNVSYKSAQLWQLSTQQEHVEAQIIDRYKKAFPEAKRVRIGTIKSQLNRKIAQLGGVTEQAGFLAMLSKVQPAFAKVPTLKPESLKFDGKRQELRVQAIADDYQHFERFKSALNSPSLTVKQGAQNNQGDRVTGSFSIVSKQSSTNNKGGGS
jgi:general secretion pathway protein L